VQAYDHNDEDTVSIAWIQGHMSKEDRLVGLSGSAAGTPAEESAKATRERALHGGVLHCARVTLRRLAELSGVCVADPRALLQVGEAIGEPECIDKPTPDGIPCENQKLFKTCGRSWMVQVRALNRFPGAAATALHGRVCSLPWRVGGSKCASRITLADVFPSAGWLLHEDVWNVPAAGRGRRRRPAGSCAAACFHWHQ
jgi:hypothetical protein